MISPEGLTSLASPSLRGGARALGGALALGFALGACVAVAPPASQFPSADDALGRMHAGFDCALGVKGTAKIDHFSPKGRVKGDLDLIAVVPDRVRFDAEKFGVMIYSLTSDGTDFKMLDTQQKQFLYGPANACNLARLTQVPMPGPVLVDLLRGEAPVLVHDKPTAQISWDDHGFYRVVLKSQNSADEEIQMAIPKEDFAKPWNQQRVRVQHVTVNQGGFPIYEVELDDFQSIHTAAPRVDDDDPDGPSSIPPIGPACEAELPHTIHMMVPHTEDDVLFKYKDAKWNPPLINGTFTQPVPGGVAKVPVDCQ